LCHSEPDPQELGIGFTTLDVLTPNLNYFECQNLWTHSMDFIYVGLEPIVLPGEEPCASTLQFTRGFPTEVSEITKYYKGAVMHMDNQLGRVISWLKEKSL
jgi:hypothetical protein